MRRFTGAWLKVLLENRLYDLANYYQLIFWSVTGCQGLTTILSLM